MFEHPVDIGNVSFICNGKFHPVFNVLLPNNHARYNYLGILEGHVPLSLSPNVRGEGMLMPNHFCLGAVQVTQGSVGLGADTHR